MCSIHDNVLKKWIMVAPTSASTPTAPVAEEPFAGKCGFACHFCMFPLGILYIVWLTATEESLEAWEITYYPPKSLAAILPTWFLCLFVAAPLLYGAVNVMSSPCFDSVDTLRDKHTRIPKPSCKDHHNITRKPR